MQEDIEHRAVALIITSGKLSGRVLKAAVSKYLSYRKEKKLEDAVPHGKQSVKALVGQNQGVTDMKISEENIKGFDRVARKYGVDYAVKKDRSTSPPRYIVFFKARDADALTAAMEEYTAKRVKQAGRTPVLERLRQFQKRAKPSLADRAKNMESER